MNISQASLSLWQECPRKFQYQMLHKISLPLVPNPKMEQGKKFHLLMQQRQLGLDIRALAASDSQLQRWLANFEQSPPVMIQGDRYPEQMLTYGFGSDFFLTAIYDLLIFAEDQVQIIDWKTHNQPTGVDLLRASWQTRLYCYLLTSSYSPEQISFSYWFANTGTTVAIAYSDHQETEQELQQIIAEMQQAAATSDYKMTSDSTKCEVCGFKYQCERSTTINLAAVSQFPELTI